MTRDYRKQYEWDKANRLVFSVSFMNKTDDDIIDYLADKTKQRISRNALIKKALREQMRREGYRVNDVKVPVPDYAMAAEHEAEYTESKED